MTGIETAALVGYIAAGAAVAGAGVAAYSAISQANATKAAADHNKAIAERNALVAQQQAAAAADQQRKDSIRRIGLARASIGANGVTTEGSPLDLLEASAANAELDNQNIRYKGQLAAMGYSDQASLDALRGKAATQQGYVQAGSAIITGAAKAYDAYPKGE